MADIDKIQVVYSQSLSEFDIDTEKYFDDKEYARWSSMSDAQRKWQFLYGRYILKNMIAEFSGLNIQDIRFEYSTNKKPFLNEKVQRKLCQNVHFSLSHCKSALVAAVSNRSVGIDVELIPVEKKVNPRFFSPSVYKFIQQAENTDRTFMYVWCGIESLVKLKDASIFKLKKQLHIKSVFDDIAKINFQEDIYFYHLYDHILSLTSHADLSCCDMRIKKILPCEQDQAADFFINMPKPNFIFSGYV